MKLLLIFFCFFMFVPKASAYVELNGFYYSDSLSVTAPSSSNRMFIEGSVGFPIDNKKRYSVGWNYTMHSASDVSNGKTATYSSSQMGPRFLIMLDKNNAWTLGLGYYLVSTASYDDGSGNSAKWSGTAYKIDIGYNFPVSDSFFVGIRANYSGARYSSQITGTTNYSNVSYSRSIMYPSLYSVYVF